MINLIVSLKNYLIETLFRFRIKHIYTEDECCYMYNFLDFYCNHFNFFKYNSEFIDIARDKGENESNKFICK